MQNLICFTEWVKLSVRYFFPNLRYDYKHSHAQKAIYNTDVSIVHGYAYTVKALPTGSDRDIHVNLAH